jgi:hypothetical protein
MRVSAETLRSCRVELAAEPVAVVDAGVADVALEL